MSVPGLYYFDNMITNSSNIMTDLDARKQKVGGEIICKVF